MILIQSQLHPMQSLSYIVMLDFDSNARLVEFRMVSQSIMELGEETTTIHVRMANEAVQLLSAQLYQSPIKAIEELVVNSYDADASECRVFFPLPSNTQATYVAVYDNGIGMDQEGLRNLWQIGRSKKREEDLSKRRYDRKQIGKFGVGKLATYVIANELTYLTKSNGRILSVSVDFRNFSREPNGNPVTLSVRQVDVAQLRRDEDFQTVLENLGITPAHFFSDDHKTWTVAILDSLREKSKEIKFGTLRWVLRTAMPLGSNFNLYLNDDLVVSSKEDYEKIIEYDLSDLPETRLISLSKKTGVNWTIEDGVLKNPLFPSGISGSVFMTERSLYGKSDDLQRSHGFFVRVRNRLINQEDQLFGASPSRYDVLYRMHAELHIDDLDQVLTASREGAEESDAKRHVRALISEVYNETQVRYTAYTKEKDEQEKNKKEKERRFVNPRLVERPIADVIASSSSESSSGKPLQGADADETWFFMNVQPDVDSSRIVEFLYKDEQKQYTFTYSGMGNTERLVTFNPDPNNLSFTLNEDHPLVRNYSQGESKHLLEDFVVAEVMLEVYLREAQVSPHLIGDILERRNSLLADLVRDHPMSRRQIAQFLRESASDEHELEINLVVAARSLGFVATQVSGSGEPDGIARLTTYPDGERVITLEAKSSKKTPSLAAIDVAGLAEHAKKYEADGCLLVAPSYPGEKQVRTDDSSLATRAKNDRISCWTVEQLAHFIEESEARQLTASDMLNIVFSYYAPADVTKALDELLSKDKWGSQELYRAILDVLESNEGKLRGKSRTLEMLLMPVANYSERLASVEEGDISDALWALSGASNGAMKVTEKGKIILMTSIQEIRRRTHHLTDNDVFSHGPNTFKTTHRDGES